MHSDSTIDAREKRRTGGWLVVLGIVVVLILLLSGGATVVSLLGFWSEEETEEFVYRITDVTPVSVPAAYAIKSDLPSTGSKSADKVILNIKSAEGTQIVLEGMPNVFFVIAGKAEVGDQIQIRLPLGKSLKDVTFEYLLDYTVKKGEEKK